MRIYACSARRNTSGWRGELPAAYQRRDVLHGFHYGPVQTYTGDFYRNGVIAGQLRCASRCWLARASSPRCCAASAAIDSSPPVVPRDRHFSPSAFQLLIIAFRQFQQRLFGLLTCTRRLRPTNHPRVCAPVRKIRPVATQWQTALPSPESK